MEKHCEKIRDNAEGFFDGSLSKQAAENVETHLKECPDCAWYFREYEKMNELLSKWKVPEASPEFEENVLNAIKNIGEKKNPSFFRAFFTPAFAVVFALLVIVFSLLVYYFSLPVAIGTKKEVGDIDGRSKIIMSGDLISAGQNALEILLNDGSRLILARGATLKFESFTGKEKLCLLEGDLKAEIRKYPGQEFRIKTGLGEVRVLGTILHISSKKFKTIVSVIEGSVSVKAKTEKVLLTKGNIVVLTPNSKILTPVSVFDALKDKESDLRMQAVSLLLELKNKQDFVLLVERLSDVEVSVRAEAASGLFSFGKDAVKPLLRALSDKDSSVRAGAAFSLGRLKAMEARDRLKWLREDKNLEVKVAAAKALKRLGEKPYGISELTKQLESAEFQEKISALKLLSVIGSASDSAKIAEQLKVSDNEVKWYAVLALENINDPVTFPALLPLLKDSDDELKKKVIQAFSNLYFSEAVPELFSLLAGNASREIKFSAIRALGYLLSGYYKADKEAQVALLAKYINAPDRLLKIAALTAYARALGATPVVKQKIFEVSVKDGNKIMKETAAQILKNFYKPDFRFLLRSIEIAALGKLKEKAAIPVLLAATKDWNSLTRQAAMEGFEYLEDKIYLPVLYEGMKDSDPRVAEAAEEAVKALTN